MMDGQKNFTELEDGRAYLTEFNKVVSISKYNNIDNTFIDEGGRVYSPDGTAIPQQGCGYCMSIYSGPNLIHLLLQGARAELLRDITSEYNKHEAVVATTRKAPEAALYAKIGFLLRYIDGLKARAVLNNTDMECRE